MVTRETKFEAFQIFTVVINKLKMSNIAKKYKVSYFLMSEIYT